MKRHWPNNREGINKSKIYREDSKNREDEPNSIKGSNEKEEPYSTPGRDKDWLSMSKTFLSKCKVLKGHRACLRRSIRDKYAEMSRIKWI